METTMTYDNNNVFAKILLGDLPCNKVLETQHSFAFRDIHPRRPVHVLVIPKGAYTDYPDFIKRASDAEICDYFRAIAEVARLCGVEDNGYRLISNIGRDGFQEVPHLHVHVLGGGQVGPMLAES